MGDYVLPPDVVATLSSIDQQVGELAFGPTPPWLFPVLENSWVAYGGGFSPTSYMRDGVGILHVRGLVQSGTTNKAIFTLPAGFRPNVRLVFTVYTGSVGRVDILPTGEVIPVSGGAIVSLDGITFVAER